MFTIISLQFNISILKHLFLGIVCGVVVLVVWCYENQDLVKLGWSYKRKFKKQL